MSERGIVPIKDPPGRKKAYLYSCNVPHSMYTREMAWHSNELGKVHSRPGGSASPLALEVGIPHQPQTSLLYASMISPIEGPRINPVQSAFDLAIGMYGGAAGTRMIGGTSFGACVTEFAQSIRSGPATVSSVISGTNSDSVTLCSSLYSSISNSQLFNNSNGLSWLTNGHHLFNSFSTVGVDGTVVFEQKVSAASRKTDLIAQIVSYLKEWNTKFEIDFSSLNIDISPIPQKLYVTDLYLSNAPAYLDLDIRSTIALDDLERLWTDVFTDFSTSSIKTVNTHAFLIKFTNEVLALFSASITVCACINFEFVATREPSRFDEVRNFLVRSSISPPVNSLSDLSNWSSLVTGQKGEMENDYVTRRAYGTVIPHRRRSLAASRRSGKDASTARLAGRRAAASRHRDAERIALSQLCRSGSNGYVRHTRERHLVDSISMGAPELLRGVPLPQALRCI